MSTMSMVSILSTGTAHIDKLQYIETTSFKYFRLRQLMDRDKSGDHGDIFIMAFALKEKVLEICQRISN